MRAFIHLRAIAASLPEANIDTDKIIPARFLKTISRKDLGEVLFNDVRYDKQGKPRSDFVLNQTVWQSAGILVTGDNFGCGSSREHAPWALADFGITCIIAPSFADIFFNNCFKNGILPIVLPTAHCEVLTVDSATTAAAILTVDLPEQYVQRANGERFGFDIDPSRKTALLEGRDDIAMTLAKSSSIDAFEDRARALPAAVTIPLDLMGTLAAHAVR